MATHKSAEKRARQSVRRNKRNTGIENALRTVEKKVRSAVGNKKVDEAKEVLKSFMSKAMKASKSGVIHFRTASRRVARLSSLVSKMG